MVRSVSSPTHNVASFLAGQPIPVERPIVRILIVSDDKSHRSHLQAEAGRDGLDTRLAPDATCAIESHRSGWAPDAIVLDQLMPRTELYAAVRELRSVFEVPVFVVSQVPVPSALPLNQNVHFLSRNAVVNEIRHLIASAALHEGCITVGNLQLDTRTSQAMFNDQVIDLTRDESATLAALMLNHGEAVTRCTLIASIGGVQRDLDPRMIDVHIVRLKAKISPISQVRIDRTADREGYLLRIEQPVASTQSENRSGI
jgi:two-component system response regulator RegX3